jgi:hypothetical protein
MNCSEIRTTPVPRAALTLCSGLLSYLEATEMECDSRARERLVSLRVRNMRSAQVTFHLEPWGEEYPMPQGATFQIIARGPEGDLLEVEVGDSSITAYAWPGSVVSLFHEEVELGGGHGERTPVPQTPQCTSVAAFLRTVLGTPTERRTSPVPDDA